MIHRAIGLSKICYTLLMLWSPTRPVDRFVTQPFDGGRMLHHVRNLTTVRGALTIGQEEDRTKRAPRSGVSMCRRAAQPSLLSSLKYRRQTELGRMNERALDCAEPRAAPCRCEHQASRRLARVAWLCRCV